VVDVEALAAASLGDAMCDGVAALAAEAVGATGAIVSVVGPTHETVLGSAGVPDALRRRPQVPRSASLAADVVDGRAPIVVPDPETPAVPQAANRGLSAYAGVPLTTGEGQVIGALAAIDERPRTWTPADLRRLAAVADYAVAVLTLRHRLAGGDVPEGAPVALAAPPTGPDVYAAGLEQLLVVSHELAALPDAREAVCAAACRMLGADVALLWEADPGGTRLRLSAQHGVVLEGQELDLAPDVAAESDTFTESAGRVLARINLGTGVSAALLMASDANAFALEPVIGADGPIGVLTVAWRSQPSEVHSGETALLRVLTMHASAAIERAHATGRLIVDALDDAATPSAPPGWRSELERELSRARRFGRPLCVARAHLRPRGNELDPVAVAQILQTLLDEWKAELRDTDLIAHTDAQCLAVALPGCTLAAAGDVRERLRWRTPGLLEASIGIAQWDGTEPLDDLLARSDAALDTAASQRPTPTPTPTPTPDQRSRLAALREQLAASQRLPPIPLGPPSDRYAAGLRDDDRGVRRPGSDRDRRP
jgi:GAF domain-containing protein/GGDEF domain-containing protein